MERVMRADVLKSRIMLMLLAGMLICLPARAFALGFGTMALQSYLNQGLKADVPLLLNASDDIKTIHVELASPSEYRQLGLQWHDALSRIKVQMQGKHSGHPVVELRSAGIVTSPILSILLKASKDGRGTYFRHYELLLDPLETPAIHQPQPAVLPVQSSASAQAPVEEAETDFSDDEVWARVQRYGPVRAGDSLSEIAYRLRKDKRFSNRQVMLALFEENPRSFADGNINHLRKGSWLNVPEGEVVRIYGDKASMQRLASLLSASRPAPKAVAEVKPVKPSTQTSAPASKAASQELRYSGRISMNGASSSASADDNKAKEENISKQFDAIHQEMMAGKLQMAELGKSVSGLNKSVQEIKQDMHALKQGANCKTLQTS